MSGESRTQRARRVGDAANSNVEELVALVSDLETRHKRTLQMLDESNRENESLQSKLNDQESRIQQQAQKILGHENMLRAVDREYTDLKSRFEKASEELRATRNVKKTNQKLADENTQKQQRIEELENVARARSDELARLQDQQTLVSQLEEEVRDVGEDNQGLRNDLLTVEDVVNRAHISIHLLIAAMGESESLWLKEMISVLKHWVGYTFVDSDAAKSNRATVWRRTINAIRDAAKERVSLEHHFDHVSDSWTGLATSVFPKHVLNMNRKYPFSQQQWQSKHQRRMMRQRAPPKSTRAQTVETAAQSEGSSSQLDEEQPRRVLYTPRPVNPRQTEDIRSARAHRRLGEKRSATQPRTPLQRDPEPRPMTLSEWQHRSRKEDRGSSSSSSTQPHTPLQRDPESRPMTLSEWKRRSRKEDRGSSSSSTRR